MSNPPKNSFQAQLLELVQTCWKRYETKLSELLASLTAVRATQADLSRQSSALLESFECLRRDCGSLSQRQQSLESELAAVRSELRDLRQACPTWDDLGPRLEALQQRVETATAESSKRSTASDLRALEISLRGLSAQLESFLKR
jgi:chromosome segregation ATPase